MKTILRNSGFLTIVLLIANLFFVSAAFGQATVMTDLLDYPPGATAIITGSGFQAGETVTLLVEHVGDDPLGTDEQYHQPWTVVADGSGNIETSWYVPEDGDALGATFLLTADGSIAHAERTFTDASNFTGATIGAQNTALTYGVGNSTIYAITINRSGNGNLTVGLSIDPSNPLPIGATSTFSVSSVSFTGNTPSSKISNLTISTTNFLNAGSYNFKVKATGGGITIFIDAVLTINKADASVTVNGYTGTYDAAAHGASGSATGVGGVALTGLILGDSFTNVPGGTASWTFTNANYADESSDVAIVISKATSTTVVTVGNSTYDGNPHGGTANATGAGGLIEALTVTYAGVSPTVYPSSSTAPTAAGTYAASASYSGDDNHNGSSDSKNFTIGQATTETTVAASAGQIKYMDEITLTARIVPKPNTTTSPLTGTVEFKIGDETYAALVPVVPIPDDLEGAVQAMLITQVTKNLPSDYIVKAIFTSSNDNYSDSQSHSPELKVVPRNASPYNAAGFYAGDLFAWTTGSSTSTGTVTMTAVITDANTPKGDVRGAKVSFYFVNSDGIRTPIPSAQNVPVGLVDVTDGSVGTASAIVQLNIGSNNTQSFNIAVGITGGYTINSSDNALSQSLVTVSKPVAGGFICGGSQIINTNSSGYIKGCTGLPTDYGFDIQYTKSGTNPKGKATITVRSYYKKDGILDFPNVHIYKITTNAIASLNVTGSTGTFSAKANLVEELNDLNHTIVAIEGGSTFQMVVYQCGNDRKIAITLYRKAGGIWFSSNWVPSKTVLQSVSNGSEVYVAGGGSSSPSIITAKNTSSKTNELDKVVLYPIPFDVKVYPNPTQDQFILAIEGGSTEKVEVLVYDSLGRMVKQIDNSDGQQIKFGEELPSGAYIAIVSQGINQKTVNLIKQ